MSEIKKEVPGPFESQQPHHHYPDGRRCCGRLLSEKCSPEEEAANTDKDTGKKHCCRGGHH